MRTDQAKGAVLVLAGITGLTGAAWAIRHRQKKGKSYDDLDSEWSDLMLWVVMLLNIPGLNILRHSYPILISARFFLQAWCPSLAGLWQACERTRAGKQIPSSETLWLKCWPESKAWKAQR